MAVTVAVRVPVVGVGSVGAIGSGSAPMAGALSWAESVIVPPARSRAGTVPATGDGNRPELTGPWPLGSMGILATRARSAALTRPHARPIAAIDPPPGPVSGTATRSGRTPAP